jgi:hypothetical protein
VARVASEVDKLSGDYGSVAVFDRIELYLVGKVEKLV